jgi:nucleotide-binding universal stress UspA family protein
VLHAIERFVPPAAGLWYDARGSLEQANSTIVARQKRTFENLASILRELGLKVEIVIRIGKASKCILNEAKEWEADLIVVGSHEHTALTRLLFGSVSRFVCEHARCSVEVVH